MTEPPITPFPASPYCRVRARVASIWADGPDDGTHPDWRPATGEKVSLTPSIGSQLLTYNVGGTDPIIVTVERVDCVVDADGWLVKSDGRPVYIAPTDDPMMSATGWTWTATIKGKSIVFSAPAGGTVNLALFVTTPAVPTTPTPSGGSVGVTVTDTPTAPTEGRSASYLVTSAVSWPARLVWSTDPDGGTAPTITGTALVSLFTLGGTTRAIMGATFPALPSQPDPDPTDSTPPTVGTMISDAITANGFTLTVSGASDAVGLHALPYAFTTDGGSTWSAYQTSPVYVVAGKKASTGYSCNWRVRDAAGNVSTGTAQTVTTETALVITDDFNRADGPLGSPWLTLGTGYSHTIVSNAAKGPNSSYNYRSILDIGQPDHKASVTVGAEGTLGVVLRSDADGLDYFRVINAGPTWYIVHVSNNSTTTIRYQWPQAGPVAGDTIGAQAVSNGAKIDFTVFLNGAIIKTYAETGTYAGVAGTHVGIWSSGHATTALDDFEAVTL